MIKLFPYQLEGAKWLSGQTYALLADDCGLGKSAQAIHACELVNAKRVLVVCRAIARDQWRQEFKKFSSKEFDLMVTNYEALHKIGPANKWDVLIVDESHFCKEPRARRTQLVFGKAGQIHNAKRTWCLTATPTPNHAGELWPFMYAGGRTKIGYNDFIERYCRTRDTGFGRQIIGTRMERKDELLAEIKPYALRRTKEQVMEELPPIFYQDLIVPPGPVEIQYSTDFVRKYLMFGEEGQKRLARDIEEEYGIIGGICDGKTLSDEVIKAFQASAKSISTVRRYVGMQKVFPVVELISGELDAKAYKKIVLFTWHKDITNALHRHLKRKYNAATLYGGTDPEKVAIRVKQFQEYPNYRVLICNIQTAGTSITLTAANQVMFVEQSFVPADMHQAIMRCHRIGQKEPVTCRFVGLANSIDQHIAGVLRRKTQEISELMDGVSQTLPTEKITKKTTIGDLL